MEPDSGEARLVDEDGDGRLSEYVLRLWAICGGVRQRFTADVIFTYSSYSIPDQRDGAMDFFVPRDHPQFAAIVSELVQQLEPLRRSLLEHHASRNLAWTPDEIVSIVPYSGVLGALAFSKAMRETIRKSLERGGMPDMDEAVAAGANAAAQVVRGVEKTH